MIGSKSKHVAIHGDTFAAAADSQYPFFGAMPAFFLIFFSGLAVLGKK